MALRDCDELLRQLWDRCSLSTATQDDWSSLYRLVKGVLMTCHMPVLSTLPADREAYVDEFFSEKVFLAMRRGVHGPDHCGALAEFFRRYLLTIKKSYERELPLDGAADPTSHEGGGQLPGEQTSSDRANEHEQGRHEVGGQGYSLALSDLKRTLAEDCGLKLEDLTHAAQRFLHDEPEWVGLMLRFNACADPDEQIPLSQLSKVYRIKSYHYKAGQLGLVHRRAGEPTVLHGTKLGEWLAVVLRAPLTTSNWECARMILQILCFVALSE